MGFNINGKRNFIKFLIFTILIILISNRTYCQNSFFVEYENRFSVSNFINYRPSVNIYGFHLEEGRKLGFYYWASANSTWGEAYGGLMINPAKWILLGFGAGLETCKTPYRFNTFLFLYERKFRLIQWYEYGGTGFWYYVLLDYYLTKTFRPGILLERYYGFVFYSPFFRPMAALS